MQGSQRRPWGFFCLLTVLLLLYIRPPSAEEVARRLRPSLSEATEVRLGRWFIVLLALITYGIVLARPASIFAIARFSFSGYAMLVPTLVLGLRWRRFTAAGAIVSVVAGNAVLLPLWALDATFWDVLPVGWGSWRRSQEALE